MKRISDATAGDFLYVLNSVNRMTEGGSAEELAQAFVDTIYEYFQESLVLLRLFSSVSYADLPARDKALVDKKANDSGTAHLYRDRTPVLTLLGTRGQKPEWNDRDRSQRFRCIPLVSSGYVASLPMLAMQFKKMNLDLGLLDSWETTVFAKGKADQFSGMLYVPHAGVDKDEQGRMIVPHQDFVAENSVRTAFGFGSGYSNHPAIVALFAFTNEILSESMVSPFASLLDTYMSISRNI